MTWFVFPAKADGPPVNLALCESFGPDLVAPAISFSMQSGNKLSWHFKLHEDRNEAMAMLREEYAQRIPPPDPTPVTDPEPTA